MRSGDITTTDATLKNLLISNVEESIAPKITKQIDNKFEDSKIKLGKVSKFYPYQSKAEVLLPDKSRVICKLPHHYMGDIIDLYTPTGDRGYCERLKEPCLYPRGSIPCLVLQIKDDKEYFLVNYYLPDDLVGINPPKNGNLKLSCITATNEAYIEFGYNGLNIVSPGIDRKIGEFEDDLQTEDYASSTDVYTKEEVYNKQEVYTKEEVDELIHNLIEQLTGE
jgi:hypothetical protein